MEVSLPPMGHFGGKEVATPSRSDGSLRHMGFSGHLDLDRDMPDLGWHPQNSIRSYFPGRRLIPCPQAATGSPKIDLSSEFGLLKLRTSIDFGPNLCFASTGKRSRSEFGLLDGKSSQIGYAR